MLDLRRITQAPIKYVILTHGHWDHVGGLAAVREPAASLQAAADRVSHATADASNALARLRPIHR